MNKELESRVQEMIANGYSENEIASYINKKTKPPKKRKTISIRFKFWTYIIDLIPPTVFFYLIYVLLESKYDIMYKLDIEYHYEALLFAFALIFYSITILEWLRRKKEVGNKPFYFRFLYILVLLIFFVVGAFYVDKFKSNELKVISKNPRSTKLTF